MNYIVHSLAVQMGSLEEWVRPEALTSILETKEILVLTFGNYLVDFYHWLGTLGTFENGPSLSLCRLVSRKVQSLEFYSLDICQLFCSLSLPNKLVLIFNHHASISVMKGWITLVFSYVGWFTTLHLFWTEVVFPCYCIAVHLYFQMDNTNVGFACCELLLNLFLLCNGSNVNSH